MNIQLTKLHYEDKDSDIYFLVDSPCDCHRLIFRDFIRGVFNNKGGREIINSVTERKEFLEDWKKAIAKEIVESAFDRFRKELTRQSLLAISISFFFCKANHNGNDVDIDNFTKPVIDAAATAVFDAIAKYRKMEELL
jgi:hypothetical protein